MGKISIVMKVKSEKILNKWTNACVEVGELPSACKICLCHCYSSCPFVATIRASWKVIKIWINPSF